MNMTRYDAIVATILSVILILFALAAIHHVAMGWLLLGVGVWFGVVLLYMYATTSDDDFKRGGF